MQCGLCVTGLHSELTDFELPGVRLAMRILLDTRLVFCMTKVPLEPQLTVLRIVEGEKIFPFLISKIKNLLPTPKGYIYWLLYHTLRSVSAGIANV